MAVQAIETRYAGCHFRSRLEARWAVFFDHLGIEWEHEPQGFDVDGTWYLPDFWLPGHDMFVEIKPEGYGIPRADEHKFGSFVRGTGKTWSVFKGIWRTSDYYMKQWASFRKTGDIPSIYSTTIWHDGPWDSWCSWLTCKNCGSAFFGNSPGFRLTPSASCCGAFVPSVDEVDRALVAARSARFQ